jgi:cob(I)alamin adenosyltransferase
MPTKPPAPLAGPATPPAAEPPAVPAPVGPAPADPAPLEPAAPPTEAPPQATRRAPSLVLIATGDGKGKTTAAMGTVLRALGRGWKVCVVQFLKSGKWKSGEARMLSELGAEWHVMGDGFTWEVDDLEHSAEMARSAWAVAKEAIASGRYQLVVLDEVTYPVNWGWLPSDDVAHSIASRPTKVNIFVTGRDAPAALVDIADTVTDMRNVKHAYEAGIREAKGIDF